MFEAAEIGHKLSKESYRALEPGLRSELLEAQFELSRQARFPVIILISGVRGAGKGETVNLLSEWMDPRHIRSVAFDTPSDEERDRPAMWRYWRALPPKGKIGILFGSWYTQPIIERVFKQSRSGDLVRAVEDINQLEAMLAADGALILKFWFHLSKKAQKKRLKEIESNPETRWRITRRDWDFFELYDRFVKVSATALRETHTAHAPWHVVEGTDPQYRAATVGTLVLNAIKQRLKERPAKPGKPVAEAPPVIEPVDHLHLLSRVDLSLAVSKPDYEAELVKLQGRLARLARHPRFAARAVVCVFEGMDAAGKGGAIRRIAQALDARLYHIIPIAAPTDEERAQQYLWRFWRHLPRLGRFVIYDRSWYGRVLVERVEKFCSEADWLRAYGEINAFEAQIAARGGILVKYWLQISPDEQLKRFREREKTRFKQFKITPEDWRNRDKWDAYQIAASDMIERTSTDTAPWIITEANDKYWARTKVMKTLVRAIEAALD